MADTKTLPQRSGTVTSALSDEAIPEVDPNSTAGLLAERLQAWKHAVSYLVDYMEAVEKIHKSQSKEYEKALKAISHPLKEGHHFDQSLGGIAGCFENLRSNTQGIINTNLETEKSIKGSVLPILERLHKEIKHKAKELAHGAQKGTKEVEKARNTTQKHIELLGQQTAAFESVGGKLTSTDDPYVVHRGVLHRLHKQLLEENNNRNDLIAVQNNCETFETHVVEVIQQAMGDFIQLTSGQAEKTRALYSDMLAAIQSVPANLEWKGFVTRSGDRLINPNDPLRSLESVTFPNMEHSAVKPLIEGSLERKSRNKLSWGYSAGYYVVTPSKFLHEFKDSDITRVDPKPELSIYLPEAVIGTPSGNKFNIRGKDKSKSISSKLTGSSELAFQAHTPDDAEKWFDVIKNVAGATGPAEPTSTPNSPPIGSDEKSPTIAALAAKSPSGHSGQESGVTGADPTANPDLLSPTDGPSSKATAADAPAPTPAAAPTPSAASNPALDSAPVTTAPVDEKKT